MFLHLPVILFTEGGTPVDAAPLDLSHLEHTPPPPPHAVRIVECILV